LDDEFYQDETPPLEGRDFILYHPIGRPHGGSWWSARIGDLGYRFIYVLWNSRRGEFFWRIYTFLRVKKYF